MIPSILNQLISLIKNTSLAYIISVNELTYAAYQVNAQLLTKPFQVLPAGHDLFRAVLPAQFAGGAGLSASS
jgi:ABC-type amino acid transport system permease subunit